MFGGSSVAIASHLNNSDLRLDQVGLLVWCIDTFGAKSVSSRIVELSEAGEWSVVELKRSLNRDRVKRTKHNADEKRRENHAGSDILYRGPIRLWQSFDGRECRTVNRKKVLVGTTDREYSISGIGIPCPAGHELAERPMSGMPCWVSRDVITGDMLWETSIATRKQLTILESSRILIDFRHGIHDIMVCELVRTKDSKMRFHLWLTQQMRNTEDCPSLVGGIAYESPKHDRVIGLMGLPI